MATDTNPLPGLPVSKEEAARISRGSFEKAVGERTKLAKLEAAKAQADARAMLSGRDAEALRIGLAAMGAKDLETLAEDFYNHLLRTPKTLPEEYDFILKTMKTCYAAGLAAAQKPSGEKQETHGICAIGEELEAIRKRMESPVKYLSKEDPAYVENLRQKFVIEKENKE